MGRYEEYQDKVDLEILEGQPSITLLKGKLHLTKANSTAVYYSVMQYIESAGGYVNQVWSVKNTTPAHLDDVVIINGWISVSNLTSSSVIVTGDGVVEYNTNVVSSTHRSTNIKVGDPTKDITVLI